MGLEQAKPGPMVQTALDLGGEVRVDHPISSPTQTPRITPPPPPGVMVPVYVPPEAKPQQKTPLLKKTAIKQ